MERFTNISFRHRMQMGDEMATSQALLAESLVRFAESWGLDERIQKYKEEAEFGYQLSAIFRIFDHAHGVRKPRKLIRRYQRDSA